MKRRTRPRPRSKQINILHTNTHQRHSQKELMQMGAWFGLVLAMIVAVGISLHFGINFALNQVLYTNPRYVLTKIQIEPHGRFTEHLIRQATGLEPGQNLWTLNLRQISRDLERLPSISKATVERHFPDRVTIQLTERVPVVKIMGQDAEMGSPELFFLDREGVVLKPRADETTPPLPEVTGLPKADTEFEPGAKLVQSSQSSLARAMEILDAIEHTKLHTSIDIRTIDLSNPLAIKILTTRNMTITFRPDYIDQQLQRLMQIFEYTDFQDRTIQTVDLTPDCNVPVTFCQNQ